jgi:hypothetical protein
MDKNSTCSLISPPWPRRREIALGQTSPQMQFNIQTLPRREAHQHRSTVKKTLPYRHVLIARKSECVMYCSLGGSSCKMMQTQFYVKWRLGSILSRRMLAAAVPSTRITGLSGTPHSWDMACWSTTRGQSAVSLRQSKEGFGELCGGSLRGCLGVRKILDVVSGATDYIRTRCWEVVPAVWHLCI